MRVKFTLLVLLQVALLFGIIAYRQHWVSTGDKILLRTVPFDPRDLFRGDYVDLRYEISTLDLDKLGVKEDFKPGDKAFVLLERNPDGTFYAASLRRVPPVGGKFIQGKVQYQATASRWEVTLKDDSQGTHRLKPPFFSGVKTGDRVTFCCDESGNVLYFFKQRPGYKQECRGLEVAGTIEEIKETKFRNVQVEYGIESYFVEEGTGKAIESARNAREAKVEVSLRKDGKGIITGLIVGEKTLR